MGNNPPKKISYKNKLRIATIREHLVKHLTNIEFSPETFSNQFTIKPTNSNVTIQVICPNDQKCNDKIWAELVISINGSTVPPKSYGLHRDSLFTSMDKITNEITRVINWYVYKIYKINSEPGGPLNQFTRSNPRHRHRATRGINDLDSLCGYGTNETIYESNYGHGNRFNLLASERTDYGVDSGADRMANLRAYHGSNDRPTRFNFGANQLSDYGFNSSTRNYTSNYKFKFGPNSESNCSPDNTDWSCLFGG